MGSNGPVSVLAIFVHSASPNFASDEAVRSVTECHAGKNQTHTRQKRQRAELVRTTSSMAYGGDGDRVVVIPRLLGFCND